MSTVAELCANAQHYPQHALLLFDAHLERLNANGEPGLPAEAFAQIAEAFCGIRIALPNQENFWELASGHPDVFVACRSRAQLRREELERLFTLTPYPPAHGARRLFLIDRCERLTPGAANSLLKVLEEPLIPTLFLLTASRKAAVLPTILSRCQRLPVQMTEPLAPAFDSALVAPLERLQRFFLLAAEKAAAQENPAPHIYPAGCAVPSPSHVAACIECAEELGRLLEGEALRGMIVSLVAEMCQKGPHAHSLGRFILSELREWKEVEPYHPKSSLWLLRILLLTA